MSAVITLLEQSTCQAGRKSNQTSCRKVGTFRNQTAGYADCDDETACYVDGNVAKVATAEEVLFCHTNKRTINRIRITIPLLINISFTFSCFLSILSSSFRT